MPSGNAKSKWTFAVDAIVLLPDHWHAIFTLPPGDDCFSKRMGWIKKEFTKVWIAAGGQETVQSDSKKSQKRRGVWQMRFWEHTIRNDDDFEAHVDYIHYNSVKHGYVSSPADWKWSSFHAWVGKGAYPSNWGTGESAFPMKKSNLKFGE